MTKRILVPFDDKDANAYSVLPVIADIARSSGATVRLVHVAPLPGERVDNDGRVVAYENQEMERIEFERLDSLKAAEAELEGVPVESVVRFGSTAREILVEADAFGADLIAVSVRPRRWLGHVVRGIAGALLRRSRVPVLPLAVRRAT
jgi:nucleotide-binding universal stress UspA family protein